MHFGRFVLAALFVAATSAAHAELFDFESTASTSTAAGHPGAFTSLVQLSGSLSVTFTRQGGGAFDVIDSTGFAAFSQFFPASFGVHSLDPFTDPGTASAFIANFSAPITSASLSFGDFGGDDDTMTLNAYSGLNGTGTLLASSVDAYGVQSFPLFDTISAKADGIRSLVFIGGSAGFPNSLYYDNLSVSTPEPGSLALFLGMGITATGLLRRRKKASNPA
jgi:hypothetical protein